MPSCSPQLTNIGTDAARLGVASDSSTVEIESRSTHRRRAFLSLMQACPQVAHEFNSLLLTISAGVMVARDGDAAARTRGLELVDTAAQQARLMTRAMIRLSQCTGPTLKEFNLSDVAREMTAFGRALLPNGIALSLDVVDPRARVWTDQSALLSMMVQYFRHAALVLSPGDRVRVTAGTMLTHRSGSACGITQGGRANGSRRGTPEQGGEREAVLSLRQEHADPDLLKDTLVRQVRADASELRACLERPATAGAGGTRLGGGAGRTDGRAPAHSDASALSVVLPRGRACHLTIFMPHAGDAERTESRASVWPATLGALK